jgi:RNase P subunit RPR2
MGYYNNGPSYATLNKAALTLLSECLGLVFVKSTKKYFCDHCTRPINIGDDYAYRIIHHERVKKRTCVDCLNNGFSS